MDLYDVRRRKELLFHILLKARELAGADTLEIGCGTGLFSEELAARKCNLTVLDIGPGLVDQVTGRLHCQGTVGDACCLPFPDGSFDYVISSECIEHTNDPKKAIAEMCRVCRPGGTVCFTTPNKVWYPVLWLSQKLNVRKFRGVENWIFPREAIRVMKKSGMGQIKAAGCHLWPFQVKFSRPLLTWIDRRFPGWYRGMINFGVVGSKPAENDFEKSR